MVSGKWVTLNCVAEKTDGWSMAEIKEIFISSARESFLDKSSPFITSDHVMKALYGIKHQNGKRHSPSLGFRNGGN